MASIFDPNNPTAFNLLGNQQQEPFTINQENYQQPNANANITASANGMNRNQKIGYMLSALSDAFAGRDVAGRAMARAQAFRQQAEVDRQRQEALRKQELLQELSKDPRYTEMIKLSQAGLDPKLATSSERKIVKGADGFNYFADTRERVFPDVVVPENKPDEKEVFNFKNSLRDDYNAASKEFLSVRNSFSRILELGTAEPSAAGDLALIFNYMKMLDPGSVVRESEFAVAAAAGGYGERAQAAVNQINTGERLSDKMRTDFQNQALNLYQSQLGFQQENENYYKDFAKNNDLKFNDIGPVYSEQLNDKTFDFRVNNTFSLQDLQSLAITMSITPENYDEKQIEIVTKKLKELKEQQNN